MNRMFYSYVLFVYVVAVPVDAAVFERDWKTPGDGLLTYDDVNRREWLDLSQSALSQFPEPRLENAIVELAPGGRFEGFRQATDDDVIALANSAGIDTTKFGPANGLPTKRLVSLLYDNDDADGHVGPLTLGILRSMPDFPTTAGQVVVSAFHVDGPNPFTGLYEGGLHLVQIPVQNIPVYVPGRIGLMLYRPVPEPSSLVLFATAWIGLPARRRRRNYLTCRYFVGIIARSGRKRGHSAFS